MVKGVPGQRWDPGISLILPVRVAQAQTLETSPAFCRSEVAYVLMCMLALAGGCLIHYTALPPVF